MLTIVSETVDPTFQFMTLDWDGRIRMDPLSPYAMKRPQVALQDRFVCVAAACDTDRDRHGIVTRTAGLLPPNHYLAVCVDYLYHHRPQWPAAAAAGKTVVSSAMIDRVDRRARPQIVRGPGRIQILRRRIVERLARLLRRGKRRRVVSRPRTGSPWSTDKDGIIAALLAAEITGRAGRDPGELAAQLTEQHRAPAYERIDAPANALERAALAGAFSYRCSGARARRRADSANPQCSSRRRQSSRGIKVVADNGWFAARPSGTEDVYKIYAESFHGDEHLRRIQDEAQAIMAARARQSLVLSRRSAHRIRQ